MDHRPCSQHALPRVSDYIKIGRSAHFVHSSRGCYYFTHCLINMRVLVFASLCAIASIVGATRIPISHLRTPVPPAVAADDVTLYNETTFEQLIDHDDPSLGTFSQRYWWNAEFYTGPGSPVSDKECNCLIPYVKERRHDPLLGLETLD